MYQHKTTNHLVFDKLRNITFELDEMAAYLRDSNTGNEKQAQVLSECSTMIFDDVYKALRESWSSDWTDEVPPYRDCIRLGAEAEEARQELEPRPRGSARQAKARAVRRGPSY